MKPSELQWLSNESLALLVAQVKDEAVRRHLNVEAVPLHAGHVVDGRPAPPMVRVIQKLAAASPADLAKVEALLDHWKAAR